MEACRLELLLTSLSPAEADDHVIGPCIRCQLHVAMHTLVKRHRLPCPINTGVSKLAVSPLNWASFRCIGKYPERTTNPASCLGSLSKHMRLEAAPWLNPPRTMRFMGTRALSASISCLTTKHALVFCECSFFHQGVVYQTQQSALFRLRPRPARRCDPVIVCRTYAVTLISKDGPCRSSLTRDFHCRMPL